MQKSEQLAPWWSIAHNECIMRFRIAASRFLAMLLLCNLQATVLAQPPESDNQRILRDRLTAEDIEALSRQLSFFEMKDAAISKVLDAVQKDPSRLKEFQNPEKLKDFLKLPANTPLPDVSKLPSIPQPPPERSSNPQKQSNSPFTPSTPAEMTRVPNRPPAPVRKLDPRWQNNPSVKNFVRFWEKNVGSLEKTPALKNALIDLLNNSTNGGNGSSPLENEFGNLIDPDTPFGKEVADWLDSAANGPSMNWSGLGNWKSAMPNSGFTPPIGEAPAFAVDGDGLSLSNSLLIGVALLIGLYLLLKTRPLGFLTKTNTQTAGGLAFVDPKSVVDRAGLITAFENLARRAFGSDAESWNHQAIARAFAERGSADASVAAARFYEWARYAPPVEAIPAVSIDEARAVLVRLNEAISS